MNPSDEVRQWFEDRLPADWGPKGATVGTDDEEILVVVPIEDSTSVSQFREETRAKRMELADEAQERFRRTVSWGVSKAGAEHLFTTVSTPAMTRLRLGERVVLDTLVAAGVARSRSEALAWCVRLVGKRESDWLQGLRDALTHVERAREEGPGKAS